VVAAGLGVPDFTINARPESLFHGGDIRDIISRGNAYLEAGANAVFVWGRGRGTIRTEVAQLIEAFRGRLKYPR
jgi:2-methylisocitrate lyase-like PEP mutase family enzyme